MEPRPYRTPEREGRNNYLTFSNWPYILILFQRKALVEKMSYIYAARYYYYYYYYLIDQVNVISAAKKIA